jgi:hypothetical protein
MTPEYKARRAEKHVAQAAKSTGPEPEGTIDLTPRGPRLGWLAGRLFKSSRGGIKNRSGYSQEQAQANIDNKNPYLGLDGRWYWFDETEQECETGYVTREQAEIALNDYVAWLNGPKEVQAEPMPVSIGGVPEVGLVEGNDLL